MVTINRLQNHMTRRLAQLACIALALIAVPACQSNNGGNDGTAESSSADNDANPDTETVVIDGKTFHLDYATNEADRIRGLGGVTGLDADKGMIFVFPDAAVRNFVMRDCSIDIDIIFLDPNGRITAMHHMPVDAPQGPDESDAAYEYRLKRYSSGFRAQFAIELQGGMLEQLNLKVQQKLDLDLERLKAMAN